MVFSILFIVFLYIDCTHKFPDKLSYTQSGTSIPEMNRACSLLT